MLVLSWVLVEALWACRWSSPSEDAPGGGAEARDPTRAPRWMPSGAGTSTLPAEATDPTCPVAGFVHVPGSGGPVALGSDDCTNFPNLARRGEYVVAPVCVETFPFPGVEGEVFAPHNDSPEPLRLAASEVAALDQALQARFGLRLCTASEYLWVAAGPENLPYTYGYQKVAGRCAEDADGAVNDGYQLPIGADPTCRSWAGVRDIGTRNTWVRLDDQARAVLDQALADGLAGRGCDFFPNAGWTGQRLAPELDLLVFGAWRGRPEEPESVGNMSGDSFGLHWHVAPGAFFDAAPQPEGQWSDDLLRLCADPGPYDPERDADWQAARLRFWREADYQALVR